VVTPPTRDRPAPPTRDRPAPPPTRGRAAKSDDGRDQRGLGGRENRGQAHTLEGVVAALIMLSAVIFALEMTAVTPLSASTSSQHLENQQEATARGILGAAAETGALERAVLAWNDSAPRFWHASSLGYFASGSPPNDFGAMLDRSFDSQGIAYNVDVVYETAAGERAVEQLVYQGRPSDNAVSAARSLVVFDDDPIYDRNGDPTATAVSDEDTYFAPDASAGSVYNVLRVEVVVWRI